MSPAKTDEPIDMPFRRLTRVNPRQHVLDGVLRRTNPFAAAGRELGDAAFRQNSLIILA